MQSGYLPPSPIFPQHILVQLKKVKAEASGELSAQSQVDKYRMPHINTETHKLYILVLSNLYIHV